MPEGAPSGKGVWAALLPPSGDKSAKGKRHLKVTCNTSLFRGATHDPVVRMDNGIDQPPSGYVYDIPRSTVSLAGGIDPLFDLFASRLRGYFRHDDCVQVHLDQGAIYVDCDDALSGLRPADAESGEVIQLRFEMVTAARDAWSTAHQAVADLIGVWPEISAWRALPPPPAPPSDLTLIAQARAIVIADRRPTTSYLQRKLQIGYNKAAMLIEQLERDGVISPPDPVTGKRQVLAEA